MRSGNFSINNIRPSLLFPAIWFIVSTFLLIIPGTAFPKENWLDKIWFDKWVHIGMFGILVVLWCWAMQKKYAAVSMVRNLFIIIAFICLAYGIAMEFVQKYFIINRSFDGGDIIADAAGCLLGVWFSLRRFVKK